MEVAKFRYRKIFKLSSEQMEAEPIDEFFINLQIHAYINKKQEAVDKYGTP